MAAFLIFSIFVHESGHASGCRYGGATPGDMGVGIYVSSPAFYTDLSDGYRLGRSGRVRGDLGGVYFNAVFAVAVFPFYLITGSTLLLLVIAAMLLEVFEQMLPFVRSDGYWAISDLAGVPDLFAYMGSAFRRGQPGSQVSKLTKSSRRLVRVWSAGTLIVLPFALRDVPARSARIARGIVALHFSPRKRCVPGRRGGHGRSGPLRDRVHLRDHVRHDVWGRLPDPAGCASDQQQHVRPSSFDRGRPAHPSTGPDVVGSRRPRCSAWSGPPRHVHIN